MAETRIGPDMLEFEVDEEFDDDWPCTWCAGDGLMENDDPLWYGDADMVPCSACNGTGERRHQTIF